MRHFLASFNYNLELNDDTCLCDIATFDSEPNVRLSELQMCYENYKERCSNYVVKPLLLSLLQCAISDAQDEIMKLPEEEFYIYTLEDKDLVERYLYEKKNFPFY